MRRRGFNRLNMQTKFTKENIPNAGKLMASLRYSGYENKAAIADIIDNAFDAEASTVEIIISGDQKSGKATIVIKDDGIGMDDETLSQALRLGSLTERDADSDLGRFGMGLVTGSISIAKRLEVYTRTEGAPVLVGIMDLNEMENTNSFNVQRDPATPEEEEIARSYGLEGHGTVVVLKDCDQLERVQNDEFENSLSKKLGEVFRYFLRAGKKIRINGKDVPIIDPMWSDGEHVRAYNLEATLEFNKVLELKLPTGETETFVVKVFRLPDELPAKGRKPLVGQSTQGFYILRNYRQLASADDFGGLWTRHNSLNRVRAEILVSGRFDSVMGINYTKHNVNPSQVMVDKVRAEVYEEIGRLARQYKSTKKKSHIASTELDFSEAEMSIKKKAKLLDKAVAELSEKKLVGTRKTPVEHIVREHERGGKITSDSARFENEDLGTNGPVFGVKKEGKITVITWNNAHPFFQQVVFALRDEQELVNAISYLAYALGEAKLKYSTKETSSLLDSVIGTMSKNLKALLED